MPEPHDAHHSRTPMGRATIPPALEDPLQRRSWRLPEDPGAPGHYMVELNLFHRGGIGDAESSFLGLYAQTVGGPTPAPVSKAYFSCVLSLEQARALVRADEAATPELRSIYRIWPDFPVRPLLDRSVMTVKADAALRAYCASGRGIAWAVIDSGIDAAHPHFRHFSTLSHAAVESLHRDFTDSDTGPLCDPFGHGTHVAGILAGALPVGEQAVCYEHVYRSGPGGEHKQLTIEPRPIEDAALLRGVAPECRLVSLRILDGQGQGRASNLMRALTYIREHVNADPKILRVHGVNISLGYEFDAEMFACGQSPVCVEVDRLVKSGVVVVAAAGNTGYGQIHAYERITKAGISNSINDPGNAALAITVGATHRDSPHTYGVSYFSSKGPTGDGRLKPDLVAPGERITSCATGAMLPGIGASGAAYVDSTGTSMAAPHVSGAIAAFLSIRREFIQRPEEVKRIFLAGATSLGRERYFEGHGLVDLMRAIQSI